MTPAVERVEDVPAELWIEDGRVHMDASGEASLYIKTPDLQPLSAREPEFTLLVKGDGFEATVSLDSDEARALRHVLAGGVDQ